jgi:ElaB/YqjD/DUF883 family membrane-anchored ribosome-binding protein
MGSSVDKPDETSSRVAETITGATEEPSGQELGTEAGFWEVTHNFSTALDRSLAEQPMTTVGLAAVLGFVLGALWKA